MSTLPGHWLGNFPEPVVGLVDLNAVANASAAALTGMRWAESGGVLIYNRTNVGQVRRETPATTILQLPCHDGVRAPKKLPIPS